jgi:hypothetical protein
MTMATYYARMRAKGLRRVQLWVPNTRSRKFAASMRRQSRALANDTAEREILDFIEAASDDTGCS